MHINTNTVTTKFIQSADIDTLLAMVDADQINLKMAYHSRRKDLIAAMEKELFTACFGSISND